MNLNRLAFVDLETTGANPVTDRITEIGVVTVDGETVTRWNSLVNPGCRIPPYIQSLTGITPAMVADAPDFASLAWEILDRLEGYTFVAHNARFDYGFLKNEFKRLGHRFQADVLCTVKLSRKLFPQYHRHNLDSLIERHGLQVADRHRALADAELIWQFWQQIRNAPGTGTLEEAVGQQLKRPTLPPGLEPGILDDIPDTPGVYLMYGEGDALLYVGKSVNLHQRVRAHFNADTRKFAELRLGQQTRRIEWRETVGELGALLLESQLIRTLHPVHNRKLRPNGELCAWRLAEAAPGDYRPTLISGDELDPAGGHALYGLFAGKREANRALRNIAQAHQLCLSLLGLGKTTADGRACFGHQLRHCRGACVGKEPIGSHGARLMAALSKLRLNDWPYDGPIGIVERDEVSEREEVHVIWGWRHLGTARDEAELTEILATPAHPVFDKDIYKLLVRNMDTQPRILRLEWRHNARPYDHPGRNEEQLPT